MNVEVPESSEARTPDNSGTGAPKAIDPGGASPNAGTKKPLWALAAVGAVAACMLVVWIVDSTASVATPSFSSGGPNDAASPPGPRPRAVADETTFDFGVANPNAEGAYTFLVRNRGDAMLELHAGSTTCKCTLAKLHHTTIPPGGTGQVRLEWTATSKYVLFSEQATVRTNDPDNPRLVFRVKGEIRTCLGASPSQVLFASLKPDEQQTRQTTLFSQVWDEFDIVEIKSSNPQFQWTVKPASADALAGLKARSGYLLEVTSPPKLAMGHFMESLEIYVAPADKPEDKRGFRIIVTGNRLGRIEVFGKGVTGARIVNLGTFTAGKGTKQRLTMIVHDRTEALQIKRIETTPEFVKARVTAADGASRTNRYHIHLEVPSDAPPCSYSGSEKGVLRIVTDHPRVPEVALHFAFTILPPAIPLSER